MARRTCLITGASAGIGKAYANLMAERGYNLVLTARREDRLLELGAQLGNDWGANSHIIIEDLGQIGAVDRIIENLEQNNIKIDALINNAGYGLAGTFATTKWEEQNQFLQVLLNAPTELAHKLMGSMVEQGFGRIINVASLAGHIPGSAGHTLYGAVKSYMIKFSQSLNAELEGTGVNVCALCPGFTYSEFHDVNNTRELVQKMPKFMWQTAQDVVLEGFNAVEQNKAVAVTGLLNKFIAVLFKLLPDAITQYIVKQRSKDFRRI
jgi:uncharacterized protein